MNAVMSIGYVDVPGFPVGSAVAMIAATVTNSANTAVTQNVVPGTSTVTFPNLPADTYTYSVAGVDGSTPPNTYGTPVTGTFTITQPTTVTLNLPSTVSVVQS